MTRKTYDGEYLGLAKSTVAWSQLPSPVVAIWGNSVF